MSEEANKAVLIDAIIGRGFKSWQFAVAMTDAGLAEFTGNQHNENWEWRRSELTKLPACELERLYEKARTAA